MNTIVPILAFCLLIPLGHAHATDPVTVARDTFRRSATELQATQGSATSDVEPGVRTSPAPSPRPTSTGGGPNINRGADQAKKSQAAGAAINMAMSAAMMAACMSTQPPNYALCAMGALAGVQAGINAAASNGSGKTYDASLYSPDFQTNSIDTDGDGIPESKDSGATFHTIKKGQDALAKAGFQVTPDGVKMPDGSFKPASAFNSAGSMAAAGFGAQTAETAQKVTDAVNEEAARLAGSVSSVAVDSGGGGGARSPASEEQAEERGKPYKAAPFSLGAEQRAKLVAGKTVMFDGEPIGVRGSNLFDLIHEAYGRKTANNHFILTDNQVQVRAPASTAARPARPNVKPKGR